MDGQVQFRPAEGEGIQREIRMAEINRLKRNKNISSFFLTLSLSPAKSPSLLLISPTDDDNNNQEEEEDNFQSRMYPTILSLIYTYIDRETEVCLCVCVCSSESNRTS